CSRALLRLLDIQFCFRFRLRLRFFWHGGPRSKLIEYICPKTCVARTGPAMRRRKDRYQPRAASASQPKTLKTYACSAIGRDRLTSEERLSDIVEILAQGLLWLDVLRDYHGSIRSILPPFRHRRRIDLLRD